MCGIVGYIGRRDIQPTLVDCLKRLEYRGYDSWGLAIAGSTIEVLKREGMLSKVEDIPRIEGQLGIGHTRWATSGKVSEENAHPHTDCTGRIAVVHNGIITNFLDLKAKLISEGHTFRSQTDTEVISHLIEKYYQGDLQEALEKATEELDGYYALAAVCEDFDGIAVACLEMPLKVGIGDGEFFLASDTVAFLEYTDREITFEDGDIGVITKEGPRVFNRGREVKRDEVRFPGGMEQAKKGGYEHFMLKEIHDQPRVLNALLKEYVSSLEPELLLDFEAENFQDMLLLGCGSSYYAACFGKRIIEELCNMPARAEVASEFNYSRPTLDRTWAIGISQSGATRDTNEALKKAKQFGSPILAIANRIGSEITRIAHETFYIKAELEISVAATKSFTSQILTLYLLALYLSQDHARKRKVLSGILKIPGKLDLLLGNEEKLAQHGAILANYDNIFIISRGINCPVAYEGALKFKEISYINAQAYPSGELKHGPFALLTEKTAVIAVVGDDETRRPLLDNIEEIKARNATVIAIAPETDTEVEKYVDVCIKLPVTDPLLSPVINVVALQLLSYYAAKERGCPIDNPRNLAKTVTVE